MKPKQLFNFDIRAVWDEEARVWVATSEDVPGLVTEADTIEKLVEKLKVIIPELLEANEVGDGEEVSFHLLSELTAIAHRHPA
jgi:predicted RNase H-like HicB family nuclease